MTTTNSSSNGAGSGSSSSPRYRDPSLSVDERVSDLLGRMTLVEKAGELFHDMMVIGPGGSLSGPNPDFGIGGTEQLVGTKMMTHFNLLGAVTDVRTTAEWHNRLQKYALEKTRLGIPVTLSSDPRNHFTDNVGTGFMSGVFSQWPETLGFAAMRDVPLVERFADVARQEYMAVGLRCALHPQIDLATEPRWARIGATFGEDADLTGEMVGAYIHGFQGKEGTIGPQSVTTITKHFPGGGPQKDGEDPHFKYGKEQVYPGDNLEYHLRPFKAAIDAGASQMMPYYGMPVGTKLDEVGFGFNKSVITGLLRERFGYEGIVCTDWGLITDANILGQDMPARAWGVEHLSEIERVKMVLDAGCDQFGGESRPELVIKLVESGQIPESRIDESVRRLLGEKFLLGLFEQPFVDVDAAVKLVGNADFVREGEAAQRRQYTLLTNKNSILPLSLPASTQVPISNVIPISIYTEGIHPSFLTSRPYLSPTPSPSTASIALIRLKAPYEPRHGGFESHFHAGSLAYPAAELERLSKIFSIVPTIVDIYLDRPAIVPEIADQAAALMVSFGSSSDAFLDVVFGVDGAKPGGRLPFDLPRSMEAVRGSREDVQFDTREPVFRFGDGMEY